MQRMEDSREIREVLGKYKSVDYAFIFGSVLKRLLPQSDIDILIGGELTFLERVNIAGELEQIFKRGIDIVLVKETSPELVLKAFSRGLQVLVNNRDVLNKDYFKILYLYEDRENLRRLRVLRVKRRYKHGR